MKVVYLCHFSNSLVRRYLVLKDWTLRNWILTMLRHPKSIHSDYAIWNTDFISEFEKHNEIEFHIVSPHHGMKKRIHGFEINNIHYHFFKDDGCLLSDFLRAKLKIGEKTGYKRNRARIQMIINDIKPDLVVLCGAECPSFSIGLLDVENTPTYVILQTCLNLQKYIDAGIGSDHIRDIEKRIFKKSKFFGTSYIDIEWYKKYMEINKDAICLSINFPSHQPHIYNIEKQYDFVFYGRVEFNKGIEDVIKALSIVVNTHPKTCLNIIGSCDAKYKTKLIDMIQELGITNNVYFSSYFENQDDMYCQAQKSRCAVLPGITSPLNSTIRESMLMHLPTIVYNNPAIENINASRQCLIAADMLNIENLATKMLFTIEHPKEANEIATNAYHYAQTNMSNKKIGDKIVANMKAIIHYYKDNIPIPDNLLFNPHENV